MSIGLMNFQPESFAQANPLLAGLQAGQNLYSNAIQNYYAAPMAQQQLLSAQLQNQINMPKAQYAPQITLADLANSQATVPLKEAQTQQILQGQIPLDKAQAAEAYARMPLYGAQAQLAEAQVPWVGTNALGKLYGGMGSFMRNSPVNNVIRMQNNPAFQQYVANNPQAQAQYAGLMKAALNNQVVMPNLPGMPSAAMAPAAQAAMQSPLAASAPAGNVVNTPFGAINSSDAASIGNSLNNQLMKTLYTPQQVQQITYDNSVQNMLGQAAPQLASIAKYSGIGGASRLMADKSLAAAGQQVSPDYANYLNFTRVQAPLIANEIRRAFGGQATDKEAEMLKTITNPVTWDTNPALASSMLQTLVNTLHANTRAITQPKYQNLQQAQQSISSPLQMPSGLPGISAVNRPSGLSGRVRVISPDGKVGSISASNLNNALQLGYKQVQ